MKLVSLNVAIKMPNTDQVIAYLRQENADFIALQEVVRHLEPSVHATYRSKSDIEAALHDLYPYSFFGPTWVANGFKTPVKIDYDFGGHIEQGCEVLSKYPITGGTNEFFYKHFTYMQDWSKWRAEDHGRSLLVTQVDVDGKPLRILNLHGIWTHDKRGDERTLAECEYIVQTARREDSALIIAGDFNLLPDTPSLQLVSREFRNLVTEAAGVKTRPSFKDNLESGDSAIDYIFVNDKVKVADFYVVPSEISDHFPLVVEFAL
jgi:endonuclease/exonuclease/phosphatase family metal-dependent hydrolase